MNADKFGLQHGFTILQKHFKDFLQVVTDFIQSLALGMGTGKAWNETKEKAGVRAPLNYCRIDFHGRLQNLS